MAKKIIEAIRPYSGILLFLFLLLLFHFSWKIAVDGDRGGNFMYIFGKDVTPSWFLSVDRALTCIVGWFVHLFPNTDDLVVGEQSLSFPDGGIYIGIVWGCTGIKQLFIFTGIMLCYKGPFLRKLYYIPIGWIILSIYNVMRIGLITILTNGHPDRYESLHDGIFRFIYYGIVFALWVYWEEVIVNKNKISDLCKLFRKNSSKLEN